MILLYTDFVRTCSNQQILGNYRAVIKFWVTECSFQLILTLVTKMLTFSWNFFIKNCNNYTPTVTSKAHQTHPAVASVTSYSPYWQHWIMNHMHQLFFFSVSPLSDYMYLNHAYLTHEAVLKVLKHPVKAKERFRESFPLDMISLG